MHHCLHVLQGSLRQSALFAGTDPRVVGDHIWQEAVVQHYLEEFKDSLRQCILLITLLASR